MKHFSKLISAVEITNKTNDKIAAFVEYFQTAPDKDKLWLIAIFTGKRPKRPIKTTVMKQWCMEVAGIPEWLFLESYSTVGDLGETMALLLPEPTHHIEKTFSHWMQEIVDLKSKSDAEKEGFVRKAWSGLETQECLIFNKLIGGSFRVGVSKKTLVNALAKFSGIEANQLMHSIIGNWDINEISFDDLLQGEHINYDNSKPYPFCLAYALEKDLTDLGDVKAWQVEYKWDGIRGQIVKRNDEIFIWSRGEELVTEQFPELVAAIERLEGDFVIDGEILALKDNAILLFNDLQKRLNRKNVTKKLLEEVPIGFYAYDLMEWNGNDMREQALAERRSLLESLFTAENTSNKTLFISEIITAETWEELIPIRAGARAKDSEGLMLKQKNSPYHTGRKKGDWWKWKVDPLTIDAVMIYAQKGSGRRSAHYTDYTFAVRKDDGLVTVAKAYSGLTNEEILEVSRFVKKNSIEKFGPVRTVKPELVFEIAFEGIALSNRHKSGVALRFPRISRWRKDKPVEEIDTIETVKQLILSPN
ncbi:ATP-dependent DNA ligase [Subsaximicrobium wynnwilliamsii]|uniref:DNA ligase (ATP) n=1 Tax=Subsaximicrobium wynnwilliamsii TaxID=291179 RepID=A0A5C6ZD99_9FLAO|nr:ATP-dependent DNA ligase [Subsaximicrobium wynnwilliamsii]TXD81960.1 ATP-dependent DNA ligase [Subsaximicrobium wynnwilliamsii]TXD87658.1 ATP-dependent DNA ligase [Subsaximicrobium wynnwilliamsii]TXE01405.1 ATP-dependent DNA ligase [Subsaximicrobium wynnwilliamsii]